jgi:hypothetical protein
MKTREQKKENKTKKKREREKCVLYVMSNKRGTAFDRLFINIFNNFFFIDNYGGKL